MARQYGRYGLVAIIICICALYASPSRVASTIYIPSSVADDWERQQITQKKEASNRVDDPISEITIGLDLFNDSYAVATDDQKKQLDAIRSDDSMELHGQWTKRILIVMNKLPADSPMLSLSSVQAECARKLSEVCDEPFEKVAVTEFNKLAGAPDWEGGSGIYRYVYFLNEARTEQIMIINGTILSIIFQENGEQIVTDMMDANHKVYVWSPE
jgi:hypothetical protein